MKKKKLTNNQLAFFLARITIGINLLVHGLVRIPKLQQFAEGITKGFENTYLPQFLVSGFAHCLPFIEFLLGLCLILGLKTRLALSLGEVLIAVLIFGSGLKEDWIAVGSQMVYALFFFFLIKNLEHNFWALDSKPKTKIDGFSTKK